MKKILLVEDDVEIVESLSYILQKEYQVDAAFSIQEALQKINRGHDLTILDVTLGDGSSLEFSAIINNPIIFLSARDDEATIIRGLSEGEEYITKPFKSRELMLRIEKVLSRNVTATIHYKDMIVDTYSSKVFVQGEEIAVTPIDYKIIELLFKNIGKKVTRGKIDSLIYDNTGNFVEENTVSVYIKRVRDKLGKEYIKTIKGVGYIVEKE